jgi:hypothetical protein
MLPGRAVRKKRVLFTQSPIRACGFIALFAEHSGARRSSFYELFEPFWRFTMGAGVKFGRKRNASDRKGGMITSRTLYVTIRTG